MYESIFVAVTRVEEGNNMRILFHREGNFDDLQYITKLKPSQDATRFFAGYGDYKNSVTPVKWDPERVVTFFEYHRQKYPNRYQQLKKNK